jgi:putative tricarboxylic transport membrane protein
VKSRDLISSLFWLVFGIGVCYGGYDLDLGTLQEPGSGFIFFWVGVIMIGLSIGILIGALKKTAVSGEFNAIWANIHWKKIMIVMAALFLYGFAFMPLGFILSTFLLLVFLFKAVEPQRWSVAILGSVVTTLTAYGVFQLWLGSQLPAGLLTGIG